MTTKSKTWRDVLPVHPASDLFPLMSDVELDELGADIKKTALDKPIAFWLAEDGKWFLLDGRNRLEAMTRAGVDFVYGKDNHPDDGEYVEEEWAPTFTTRLNHPANAASLVETGDPYAYVLSANIRRRHLTAAQKRELVTKLLKAQPEKSDRQIAKEAKVSDKTVGKKRAELEAGAEIPHHETRTDARGTKQPAKKPPKKKTTTKPTQPQEPTTDLRTEKTSAELALTIGATAATPAELTIDPASKATGPDGEPRPVMVVGPDGKSVPPKARTAAADIRTATKDVKSITEWLVSGEPSQLDAKACAALRDLEQAAFRLSTTASELSKKKKR
jgi:hypothetical protein